MDFKSYLQQQGLSRATREGYHYHVLGFIAFMDKSGSEVENCTQKDLLDYLRQLGGVDTSTKKLRLYALKHFFNYQLQYHKRKDNPAKRIKLQGAQRQKLYPILSPQELRALYESYSVPGAGDPRAHYNWFTPYRLSRARNKVLIGLLAFQGITTAEAARLQVGDISLHKGTVAVPGGRIGKSRELELQPFQVMGLMEYLYTTRSEMLQYYQAPTEKLFLSVPAAGKKQAGQNSAPDIFKQLTGELKQQNPRFINFLQVRASVITHWLKRYNLRQVQYRAGHRNIISTEAYQANDTGSLQQDIDNFHPLN